MGLSEGNALANEVLGQVGGEHVKAQGGPEFCLVDLEGGEDPSGDLEAAAEGRRRIKEGLLVLLQVLVVRAGKALQRHQKACALPKGPP